jgi:hypothetical protein
MKSILKYLTYIVACVLTIFAITTGILVLPVIGHYTRGTLYHFSRCISKLRVGHTKVTEKSPSVFKQSTNNLEQICTFLVGNASYLINLSYACIIFYLAALLPLIVNGKWELDTAYLLLSISIVYLLAFYLPKIDYPNIHLSFVGTPDTDFCDLHCRCLQVKHGDEYQIEINIANIGLLYYNNCSVWIYFPDGCIIKKSNQECYNNVNYRKALQIQKGDNSCLISPRDNDLSIAPFTSIRIPIIMQTTEDETVQETTKIHVSVTSESTWGMANGYLELQFS